MITTGISLKQLCVRYEQQSLFDDLNAYFSPRCWHSILGGSGVGKSTLLKAMAGLLPSVSGEILADNHIAIHQHVAWMAQDDLLLPWLNVLDNICLGYTLRKTKSAAVVERALQLLNQVGLADFAHRMPAQLSGGQRQRVALARTLIEDKPIVLIDEPFSALDVVSRLQVQSLFVELLTDKTVILVTHDPLEALRLSQKVWLMKGSPAYLQELVSLSSPTPRAIDDVEVLDWQNRLLTLMSKRDDNTKERGC